MKTPRRDRTVVILWLIAMAVGFATFPVFHRLAVTDPARFFPADAPHRVARSEIERRFPGAAPLSQVVLVIEADSVMTHRAQIAGLADALRRLDSACQVSAVLSPTDHPALERRLVAPDGDGALVIAQVNAGFASERGAATVAAIEEVLEKTATRPADVYLSGDATLGRDYDLAIDHGGERSAWATIVLVAVILLSIYRSPVAAAVSLLTLAAGLGASFGLSALAAAAGIPVAYQTRSFLVAIVYGVGTDYCLLLFSRVREEYRSASLDPVSGALSASFPVIAGSAAAVGLACVLMALAEFGLFRFSGVPLALGVLAAGAATLTLAPALMRLLGRRLFWPSDPESTRGSALWQSLSASVLSRPIASLLAAAILLAPLTIAGRRASPTFENEIDIPAGSPSAEGYAALKRHFPLARTGPLALLLTADASCTALPGGWRTIDGLAAVHALTERVAAVPGVASVYSATRPTGEAGLFESGTIRGQLSAIEEGLRRGSEGARTLSEGLQAARRRVTGEAGAQGRELVGGLESARRGAGELATGLAQARDEVKEGITRIEEQRAAIEKDRRGSLAALFAGPRFARAADDLDRFHGDMTRLAQGLDSATQGSASLESGLARGLERAGGTGGRRAPAAIAPLLAGLDQAAEGAARIETGMTLAAARLAVILASPAARSALDRLALAAEDLDRAPELSPALDHFIARSGDATLIEIELDAPPNSPRAIRTLQALRERLPIWLEESSWSGVAFHIGGASPITDDLQRYADRDLRRIGLYVVAGIFALLVGLLGDFALALAVTAFLLASYFAALGVLSLGVHAGFWPGIDWKTPFFLFVLLVAIGADYGVFLLGRAREEETRATFRVALARAMEATGPVVSSCGFVLAGTFAALGLAPIAFLQQVGIGVTAGVLLDTLIVRPFMLPPAALLLRRLSGGVKESQ